MRPELQQVFGEDCLELLWAVYLEDQLAPSLWGIAGGAGTGAAAKGILKAYTHPSQCKTCLGTGLVDDLRRCSECKGYGHRK